MAQIDSPDNDRTETEPSGGSDFLTRLRQVSPSFAAAFMIAGIAGACNNVTIEEPTSIERQKNVLALINYIFIDVGNGKQVLRLQFIPSGKEIPVKLAYFKGKTPLITDKSDGKISASGVLLIPSEQIPPDADTMEITASNGATKTTSLRHAFSK